MKPTNSRAARPAPPTEASPGWGLFHSVVAAAGWLLFLWWWSLVLARVDPAHVRFTLLFIGATLVGCVAITAAWAFHNLRLSRRKTPRSHVPTATYEFKRDRLGRHLFFADRDELVTRAAVVQIRLEHEGKVYRAFEKLAARSSTSPTAVAGMSATSPRHSTVTRTEATTLASRMSLDPAAPASPATASTSPETPPAPRPKNGTPHRTGPS